MKIFSYKSIGFSLIPSTSIDIKGFRTIEFKGEFRASSTVILEISPRSQTHCLIINIERLINQYSVNSIFNNTRININ